MPFNSEAAGRPRECSMTSARCRGGRTLAAVPCGAATVLGRRRHRSDWYLPDALCPNTVNTSSGAKVGRRFEMLRVNAQNGTRSRPRNFSLPSRRAQSPHARNHDTLGMKGETWQAMDAGPARESHRACGHRFPHPSHVHSRLAFVAEATSTRSDRISRRFARNSKRLEWTSTCLTRYAPRSASRSRS